MSILQMSLSIPLTPKSLLSAKTLSSPSVFLTPKLSNLSLTNPSFISIKMTPIRMGGGPRTYPGGVSKWEWKKMQAKKGKQLLKARLTRERQIYEMRKRAELKAAVSELERPWETVEKPPNLFSVSADEQLKELAARFQKPEGFDMWSERDGPELFRADNGSPSSRFFPKGVIHSAKPHGKLAHTSEEFHSLDPKDDSGADRISGIVGETGATIKNVEYKNSKNILSSSDKGRNASVAKEGENMNFTGKLMKKGNSRALLSNSNRLNSGDTGRFNRNDGMNQNRGGTVGELWSKNIHKNVKNVNTEVFDMSVQNDET
ncbi:hypothetical protein OROGR_024208 [Orobanche gracilis]